MTNYFKDCKTLDDAKTLFRALVFKLHPDTSGYDSQQDFVRMYSQFENFVPAKEYARESDADFNAAAFYNIVKRFESLDNVLISFVGSFIWLEDQPGHSGSTRRQKDVIKGILLKGYNSPRFSGKRMKWYYSPEGYKQKYRCNKSFDEIKRTWGSKTYDPSARSKQEERAERSAQLA